MNDELTYKQLAFVGRFLENGGNATEAAAFAGYAESSAHAEGSRLLRNVKVRAAIGARQQITQERTQITVDAAVRRINDLADTGESETVRLRALDMLMKHLGGYVTTQDVIDQMDDEQLKKLADELQNRLRDE